MLFNSFEFLYLFLPITYLVFWRLKARDSRYIWLAVTGYVFYARWNPKFCALMALSTVVSYLAGIGFLRWHDRIRRRLCLVVPIVVDLLLLAFFKYINFALDTLRWLGSRAHFSVPIQPIDIILPVGISFYTFHTITTSWTATGARSNPHAISSSSRATSRCLASWSPDRSSAFDRLKGTSIA